MPLSASGSIISGSGSFTQAGTGTTTLNAANTYGGGTNLNAGVLQLGSMSTLALSRTGLSELARWL